MSFPRYPKYKPSGVEWLGDVPTHWSPTTVKKVLDRNDGGVWGDDPESDDDPVVLRSTEQSVDGRWLLDDPARRKLSTAEFDSSVLCEGDLLVTKSSGSEAHIGKTTLVDKDIANRRCCFSNFMQRLRCSSLLLPRLGWYFFNSQIARAQFGFYSNSTTGLANLSGGIIGRLSLALPPLPEQRAIAAFLDRETAKIDGLVDEQRRLIELLKEKRQAVISHAVTKGLDPKAPMKPSGVEWLGDVPAHWEVRRLKTLLLEPLCYGANEASDCDTAGWPRFVRITDIDDGGRLRDETFRSLPPEVAAPFLLQQGDVLLARSGATVGKSFIYSPSWGTACFAGYLIRARLNTARCLAEWFYLFCQTSAYWAHVIGTQIQTTIQNVSAERYAGLTVPLPPLAEQRAIAAFLDRETSRIDGLVKEAESAITLLQERRSALISAAVTGQIDVRNAAATEAA